MIDIVFDGPPGAESGRFVETEDENGCGICVGEWIKRPDGYDVLRLEVVDDGGDGVVDTRWRPMETAPRDGTIIEMLCRGDSVFVCWLEPYWASVQALPNPAVLIDPGSPWRPVHPEWAQRMHSLQPRKEG